MAPPDMEILDYIAKVWGDVVRGFLGANWTAVGFGAVSVLIANAIIQGIILPEIWKLIAPRLKANAEAKTKAMRRIFPKALFFTMFLTFVFSLGFYEIQKLVGCTRWLEALEIAMVLAFVVLIPYNVSKGLWENRATSLLLLDSIDTVTSLGTLAIVQQYFMNNKLV